MRPSKLRHPPVFTLTAAISLLLTLACGDEPSLPSQPGPEPASVSLTTTTARLHAVGDTVRLAAEVRDKSGLVLTGFAVSWATSDAAIATVGQSGLVRAVAEGTATITATAGPASATASITVVFDPDRRALVALYEATGGPDWKSSGGWLSDAPVGEWDGVEVNDQGRVTSLVMWGNRLRGPIPRELALLDMLERLELEYNRLSGAIPRELATLANLRTLLLDTNLLTGSIPPQLTELSQLRDLGLGQNELSGRIPPAIVEMPNLSTLNLHDNPLTGTVPEDIGRLSQLTGLNLTNTGMAGPLPGSLTDIGGLTELLAGGTELCAPADPQFQEWLKSVRTQRVNSCAMLANESTAYLTQVVQSRDFPVPLVAEEEALLRVFVVSAEAAGRTIPPVRATFYLGGARAAVVEIDPDSSVIGSAVDEGSLQSSANAVIPPSVIRPGLEMVVEIDPDGTLDPALGVGRRIPESGRTSVEVREMPVMRLTLVPFLHDQDPDSSILGMTGGLTAEDPLLWTIRTLLPIGEFELTVHDPVITTSTHPGVMLVETGIIRAVEKGRGYYMGTMAPGAADWPGTAPYGPAWTSFAELDSLYMAHELGHNMGLLHAPCGPLTNADPAFPQRDGSIGAWGYDFTQEMLVPPNTADWMSYCEPLWVSEFFYSNILRYRFDVGGDGSAAPSGEPGPSLLVWGGTDPDGAPFLEPAFVLEASPELPRSAGAHSLAGFALDGGQLFSLSFDMPAIADGDGSSSFAFTIPVQPHWRDRLARITLAGPGGSFSLDADTDRPAAIVRDRQTGQIRGIYLGLSAAAREDAAADRLSDPDLEVLFSRGIPTATMWPGR